MGAVALWALAKRLWPVAAVLVVLLALWLWHTHAVDRAYARGSDAQVAADGRAVTRAFVAAAEKQHAAVTAAVAAQVAISERTDDDLTAQNDAVDRALAAYKLRHKADAVARPASDGGANPVPGAAAVDHGPAAPVAGLVVIEADDVAAAAKDAAELQAAQDWIRAQAMAWPK